MHWINQELFHHNNVNVNPYKLWLLSDLDLVGGKFEGFPNSAKYLYVHAMYLIQIWDCLSSLKGVRENFEVSFMAIFVTFRTFCVLFLSVSILSADV